MAEEQWFYSLRGKGETDGRRRMCEMRRHGDKSGIYGNKSEESEMGNMQLKTKDIGWVGSCRRR